MLKTWAVFYSETGGRETYLGVVLAEEGDAFAKARSFLLPGESPEGLRVRLWIDKPAEKDL
jgi:hypothetical protein